MATVSERSRELLEKQRLSVTHNLAWLEQALLAERRLAMEEAAKIVDGMSDKWTARITSDEHTRGMADGADFVAIKLRDGVATPRGGE